MDKILTMSVAAYNVEEYIRKVLDSLVQCNKIDRLEIFVVDDGGTDRTLDIAREYALKYPKSVFPIHKENGGYGSVVNTCIEMATGKYFKQLDGDDWLQTKNLDSFLELLEKTSADIVFTQTIEYFEKDGHTKLSDMCDGMEEGLQVFENSHFKKNLRMHSSTIKTEILKIVGVKLTEHCFYGDLELIYQPLSAFKDFYVYHVPLYVYRIGRDGQSMSIGSMRKNYKDHEKIFWNILSIYENMPTNEVAKRELLIKRLKYEAVMHFKFCTILTPLRMGYKEIRKFGNGLRKCAPDVYKEAMHYSKFFRIMVITHYCLFPIFSQYEFHRYMTHRTL